MQMILQCFTPLPLFVLQQKSDSSRRRQNLKLKFQTKFPNCNVAEENLIEMQSVQQCTFEWMLMLLMLHRQNVSIKRSKRKFFSWNEEIGS